MKACASQLEAFTFAHKMQGHMIDFRLEITAVNRIFRALNKTMVFGSTICRRLIFFVVSSKEDIESELSILN